MAELFQNFEINRVPRWPLVTRLLMGSIVLHALFITAIAYAPTVRSMLQIAGMFAGAEYVDEDYQRINIRERATMLTFAKPTEKLYYPPGYFTNYAENPALPPVADAQLIEQVRPTPPPPMPRPRRMRAAKPPPMPTPEATPEASATPEVAANNPNDGTTPSPTPVPTPMTDEELEKLAAETNVKRFPNINPKPFKDLLTKGKEMMDAGVIDLKGSISITIEADRNDDGTLANVEVTKVSTTDENLKNLALEFIQALSGSRVLAALDGTKHLTMDMESNPTEITAVIKTQMESEAVAKDKALGYNGMLFFQGMRKKGRDEEEIYKNTKISANGKEMTLSFAISREVATKMLNKQLAKPPAPPAPAT
ncbi:MAG TPA: hypothetical protein VF666_01405 [Pyrinomonadaceae bacterium]|jgi:hypothetical protein